MPVNWTDKAVQDRLLVAVIASVDNKISPAEIARMYGTDDSMTYHAVENYLRKFRSGAKEMKAAAEGLPAPTPKKATPKGKKTDGGHESPTKASGGVKAGRVTKKKAHAARKVKEEEVLESMFGDGDGDGDGNDLSVNANEDVFEEEV